ncbi:MAG: hypothetical protein GC180_09685 [Bacteroidetes bacterium]|nr:hypothetical protein [Bacteroidota bacterium]
MRKNYLLPLLAPILLMLASCAHVYTNPQFTQKTQDHQSVAIIPYQMVYTGKLIKELSPADLQKINETESQAFQLSLYNQLLRRSGTGRHKIKIEIQNPSTTNRLLLDSGVVLTDAWKESPERLAGILGVQSVICTRVEKEKFLSDLESFGIIAAGQVLRNMQVPGATALPYVSSNASKTYEIKLNCQLMNGADGSMLWNVPLRLNINYNTKANDAINIANRRCSKKFPYRDRSYYR